MKKASIAVLMVMVMFLMSTSAMWAEEKKSEIAININSEFDVFQIFTVDQAERPILGDLKITGKKEPKLSFTFPNHPVKINYKMVPQMIKAVFWESAKGNTEEYTITLSGGSTAIPYAYDKMEGKSDTIFYLMLDNEFLKPPHFDIILNAWRKSQPLKIEGYIYSKEKDFVLGKRNDVGWFTIKIILHPISINNQKLY